MSLTITGFENQLKGTINNTFGAVNLIISHSTRKPLNGIVKDVTPDPENVMLYISTSVTAIVYTLGELLKDSI